MLFSYDWLKEFLPHLPEPQKLLDELTLHSVEVEEIDQSIADLGNVVVGEVLEHKLHPDADKLNIGQFDVGEEKPRQIIFGEIAELQVGDKIPVALSPTVLPGDFKIKERKLRGELSQGMCCLKSELGILDNEEDVVRFDADVPNGTPIVDVLPLGQTVVDIDNKSMTHRADLFSHLHMAREIAAVFGHAFSAPTPPALPTGLPAVDVTIEDTQACRRYIGIELEVEVGPSPQFIADRLRACGIQVINNVVDITNYVMLEWGNPLHAFNADQVSGGIVVRRAKKKERLKALDHTTKELTPDTLVIADKKKALAIAGVIGGEGSGITNKTTRIILEAANFEPLITRKAAQQVGSRTEGAMRWEKGISPELAHYAAQRAVELLQEHANASVVALTDRYPSKKQEWTIALPQAELERLSGHTFAPKKVAEYLERIECRVKKKGRGEKVEYAVTPPFFRQDLQTAADLIEEVVRLHGVNNIAEQQLVFPLSVGTQQEDLPIIQQTKWLLAEMGATEVQNHSFYGEQLITAVGLRTDKEHIELQNPQSEDLRYMRTSLLPYLLTNVARNQHHRDTLRLFEVGHIFFAGREVQQLGVVVTGADAVRELRGIVDELLTQFHIEWATEVTKKSLPCEFWGMYEDGQALRYDVGDQIIGTIGSASKLVLERLDIDQQVAFATLSIPVLTEHASKNGTYAPLSPFPAIELDLSLLVPEEMVWADLEKAIRARAGEHLTAIDVLEVYRGKKVAEQHKGITCRLTLQSHTETLQMEQAESTRDRIVEGLAKKGVALR